MHRIRTAMPIIGFCAVCLGLVIWDAPVAFLTASLDSMGPSAYVAFTILLVLAVVFAPLTVMPLIPMASMSLGPFATALCSIVGWTTGAVIAFLLARRIGRPLLAHSATLAQVEALLQDLAPRTRFFVIVLIRLTIPVDIGSYALGLAKSISLMEYTLATAVGVTWFSFAFAYLGEALISGNTLLLIQLGGASLFIFIGAWYLLKRRVN